MLAAGAEGIAVISAITKAADRAAAVREWQALWEQYKVYWTQLYQQQQPQ